VPQTDTVCKPCRAVSGGFRDPPADYVTALSAKKADGTDMLGNAHIPPRALPDKDRDMLVAFPNPILASSSSISYVIITCQKPKRVPFPHRWQTYFIRDTACTASQQASIL